MLYLYLSSAIATIAAIVHSYLGETRLIRPLYAEREHAGVLKSLTWRRLIRAVWHLPSLCWLAMALMTIVLAAQPPIPAIPLYFAGAIYAVSGLGNLIATRGKHFGWLVLFAAAALIFPGLRAFA
jgi:hypothetical protein